MRHAGIRSTKYVITALTVTAVMFLCPLYVAASTGNRTDVKTDDDDLTIVMVGDILLHDGIEKCARRKDGTYDFSEVFRHTKDTIGSADLAIVNEEVIIGGEELNVTGYPSFNAPYEIADALADAGFDVICHATNHALDRGRKGIENCLSYWEKNHPDIQTVGIYTSEEDRDDICIYEKNGYRIAVLNYTYGTNGIPLPKQMPYAVDLLDAKRVRADLEKAERSADFTIVCPHWGTEYEHGITDNQEKWTKLFANYGADLIIGTHPHVIEPVELYETNDGRHIPVYYSLGNFINWTSGSGAGIADRMVGAMATVTLTRDDNGDVQVKDYGVKPIVSHVESEIDGSTVYFLDDYTQAKSFLNEIRSRDAAFSYVYCEELAENIFCRDLWR